MSRRYANTNKWVKFSLVYMAIAFITGFVIGTAGKLTYEATTFKPYTWGNRRPIILNCYGEDFPKYNLADAVSFWHRYNHKIDFYEMKPPKKVCDVGWIDDTIIIRKAEPGQLHANTLAQTERKTRLGSIVSVQIYFQPGAQNLDLIIEHELGHAFGYGHYDFKTHIMHSQYERMGPMFW